MHEAFCIIKRYHIIMLSKAKTIIKLMKILKTIPEVIQPEYILGMCLVFDIGTM